MFKECVYCGAALDPGEKCDCEKVDVGFCRTSYRQAKDPENQVKVLSELYDVSVATIKACLGDLYGTVKKAVQVKETAADRRARVKALLIADIGAGMTLRDAAEHRGIAYYTAANLTREFRKSLAKHKRRAKSFIDELAG